MTYSIGDPGWPLPDDLRFDTKETAEIAAIEQSVAVLNDYPIVAVWEDNSGEVIALVFHAIVYRP